MSEPNLGMTQKRLLLSNITKSIELLNAIKNTLF